MRTCVGLLVLVLIDHKLQATGRQPIAVQLFCFLVPNKLTSRFDFKVPIPQTNLADVNNLA